MVRVEEGKLLGDWKLMKEIGAGAIGTAIVAEHRFTQQKVVLKILPEDLASDRSFIMRFEEEAIALASLDHPHIAKIYTVSFIEGLYLLVVECVVDDKKETTTLHSYVKHAKLLPTEIERIAEQIASALDYAHSLKPLGMVGGGKVFSHGNMKPSNILISDSKGPADGAKICVKLSDFGLSRIVGQANWLLRGYEILFERLHLDEAKPQRDTSHPTLHTLRAISAQEDLVARASQSLMFLSPEQRHGEWSLPQAADVWSYGVLLYWLITSGEYPEGSWEMRVKSCPQELEHVWYVMKACLHPTPQERPQLLLPLLEEARRKGGTVLQTAMPQEAIVSAPQKTAPEESSKIIKEYIPEKRDSKSIEPLFTEMVTIAGGLYFRGSHHGCRDEIQRHQIRLNTFRIDKHPVTNEEFVRFLEFLGDEKDKQNHDIIRLRDSRIKRVSGKCVIERGYAKHPVVGVTWYGAQAYAAWIGRRLPTEAEWEIACCGGLENPLYPTGEDIERSQANFFSSDTTPVMSYPPNGYGLYDFAGNVYEWCQDWYEYNYYDFSVMEPDNPQGPIQGVYRVLRGGCWKSLKEDLRCAKRHRNNPGAANGTYGFRCAADIP